MNRQRWAVAQKYEKEWWAARQDQISFEFYREYAADLLQQTQDIIRIEPTTSILEIGSGAAGIITFLKADDRHAIDPLEDFYTAVPRFQTQRDRQVKYQQGRAENLPFDDRRFDFIICDNVLDHCDDAGRVFQELRRVLADHGVIYLRLNLYTTWGKFIRLLVELLGIDPGHPYTFTRKSIEKYFQENHLHVIKTGARGFFKTWLLELRSVKIKEFLKALSFSSPSKTLFLLARNQNLVHSRL